MRPFTQILSILLILSKTVLISSAAPPPVGTQAPAFLLNDAEGHRHTLKEFAGLPVVLCFFCGCAACRDFAKEWGSVQHSGALETEPNGKPAAVPVTLVIESAGQAELRAFAKDTALDLRRTILLRDPGGHTARTYDALLCPRLCVLDAHGAIRYFNNGPDDMPQKAPASAIIARVLHALRNTEGLSSGGNSEAAPTRPFPSGLVLLPQPGLTARPEGARLDLGSIDRLEAPRTTRTLRVRNQSGSPLVIERVQSSCACLEATLIEAAKTAAGVTLAPGQETEIRLTLDVGQLLPGPLQKTVWLLQKGVSTPVFTIELNASTAPAVEFTPANLDFGSGRAGGSRALRFSVAIDRRLVKWDSPPTLACTSPFIKIEPEALPPTERSSKTAYVTFSYRAILSANAPSGVFSGNISLSSSSSDRQAVSGGRAEEPAKDLLKSVALPISGEVVGEIAASPHAALFDVVHPETGVPLRITLTGASSQALQGLQVSSEVPWLTLQLLSPPAGSSRCILEVVINRKAPTGPVHAEIVLTSAAGVRLAIPVTAYVVPGHVP